MKRLLELPVFLCLIAVPAIAGVVYEIETTYHGSSPSKTESTQVAVEGRNLKMGISPGMSGAKGEMIFRGDRREMVVVDHENQSFHVMDEEAISRIAGQVGGAMAQMQGALKNVPEDKPLIRCHSIAEQVAGVFVWHLSWAP